MRTLFLSMGLILVACGGSSGSSDGGTGTPMADGGGDGVTARVEASCRRYEACGVLTSTLEECVTNSTASYRVAAAACPTETATLDALLECTAAASCPLDASTCAAESAAASEVYERCM